MDGERTENSAVGILGERAAARFLKKNKYTVIAKNVHSGKSEIDIIAKKADTLVFVEVKSRTYDQSKTYLSRPADAVNKSKISYLIRGADKFCSETGAKYASYFKRFDIIEVYFERIGKKYKVRDIRHFENAFRRN